MTSLIRSLAILGDPKTGLTHPLSSTVLTGASTPLSPGGGVVNRLHMAGGLNEASSLLPWKRAGRNTTSLAQLAGLQGFMLAQVQEFN